jgi:hypothetical protein
MVPPSFYYYDFHRQSHRPKDVFGVVFICTGRVLPGANTFRPMNRAEVALDASLFADGEKEVS